MDEFLDKTDLAILRALQQDASQSVDDISEKVSLSRNACWRRIRRMDNDGIIERRVALVDAEAVGLSLTAIVLIRTNSHEKSWLNAFRSAVRSLPEVVSAHRMSGDLDYILRVKLGSVKDYDAFYKRLIEKVPIADVSASFVMENIKDTTELPL